MIPANPDHYDLTKISHKRLHSLHAAAGDGTYPSPPRGYQYGDRPQKKDPPPKPIDELVSEFWPNIEELKARAVHSLTCDTCGKHIRYKGNIPAGWRADDQLITCPECKGQAGRQISFIERKRMSATNR